MDWVPDFYTVAAGWWAEAEGRITERDHRRVRLLHEHAGATPRRVLELGCGYGTTAVAMADAGHHVTALEVSSGAVAATRALVAASASPVHVEQADFFQVRLPGRFDVVAYWNGFGVGSDDDQRRLLTRIAEEWLAPAGVALIDVMNPFVWASWHGDIEHKSPEPALGYHHELYQQTTFDPVTCTVTDTWWEAGTPERRVVQYLRCYSPADLSLLLEGTGLRLAALVVGERRLSPTGGDQDDQPAELLTEQHEYLAVLQHRDRPLTDPDAAATGQ